MEKELKLLANVDKATLHRGKKYLREGKVSILSNTNSLIESKVSGSLKEPYTVKIEKEGHSLKGSCSCPIKHNCKHIAATILHTLQAIKGSSSLQKKTNHKSNHTNPPRLPSPSLSDAEKTWFLSIESATSSESPSTPSPKSFGIFYILHKRFSYQKNSTLQINYHVARRKKDGNLSSASGKQFDTETILKGPLPDSLKNACEEIDLEIIQDFWKQTTLKSTHEISLLQKMIATQRCVWESIQKPPLQWGSEKKGLLSWETYSQTYHLSLTSEVKDAHCFLMNEGGLYIDPSTNTCGLLLLPEKIAVIKQLLASPAIEAEKIPWIQQKLKNLLPNISLPEKKFVTLRPEQPIPCFFLSLKKDPVWGDPFIKGELSFLYGNHRLPALSQPPLNSTLQTEDTIYQIPRNPSVEIQAIQILRAQRWFGYGIELNQPFHENDLGDLFRCINDLKNRNWIIETSDSFPIKNLIKADQDWYVEVSDAKNHWFDLEIGQLINGKRVNLIPFLQKFLSSIPNNNPNFENFTKEELKQECAITLDTGEVLIISMEKIKSIIEPFLGILNPSTKATKIRLSDWQAGALSQLRDSLPAKKLEWQSPERYTKMAEQLKSIHQIEIISSPKGLQTELRHYQVIGLSWLQFLRRFHLAGILADDMGLGKTIQTLAHILLEKEEGRLKHPILIVAPTTLVGNWLMEAQKFAPSLKVLTLQGFERKKHFDTISDYDLIITTYPLLARDQQILTRHQYHVLILDEAQNIKNAKTQAHNVLRELQATHRLCLTGTPLENHLGELWSLFSFLLPGFLGDEKQFQKLFRKPIEKEGSLERKKILQKRVAPFLLRRTKQEVIQELPPKTEIITPIELTEKQQELYEAVRLTMMNKVMAEVEAKGLSRSRIVLLDALLKLRQICCDPRLLKTFQGNTIEHSAKLLHLKEFLPQMIENNHRILLFSQFTSMLSLIEDLLKELSIPYVTITGDTKDRLTPVQKFQSGEVSLFLISLKAGGTGLNLTAADTVIHYDPWWNPAVEAQATDRAHRLGQTKSVFVYKWIAARSVEEKILQLQTKKKALTESLFEESNTTSLNLNLEDLRSLFAPLS